MKLLWSVAPWKHMNLKHCAVSKSDDLQCIINLSFCHPFFHTSSTHNKVTTINAKTVYITKPWFLTSSQRTHVTGGSDTADLAGTWGQVGSIPLANARDRTGVSIRGYDHLSLPLLLFPCSSPSLSCPLLFSLLTPASPLCSPAPSSILSYPLPFPFLSLPAITLALSSLFASIPCDLFIIIIIIFCRITLSLSSYCLKCQ